MIDYYFLDPVNPVKTILVFSVIAQAAERFFLNTDY